MPTKPPEPAPLNLALLTVVQASLRELEPVWSSTPADIGVALQDVLPALVEKWSLASASAAADWYDELREVKAIQGRFTAIIKPLENLGAEALAGWGSQPLQEPVDLDEPTAVERARSRVEGGVQKRLVNAANETVTTSAVEDPNARGWMRRTRPQACKFCIMVASRGGVFTKASSTFACHEHCYCEAVPAWGGQALPVKPYKPSDKPSTAADRARVRKWIAANL